MNPEEMEELMEREGYVDSMGGRVPLERMLSEFKVQFEIDLVYRNSKDMVIYIERQPDKSYQVRSYIPDEAFGRKIE